MYAGDSSIHGMDAKIVLQSLVRHADEHIDLLVQQLQEADDALKNGAQHTQPVTVALSSKRPEIRGACSYQQNWSPPATT